MSKKQFKGGTKNESWKGSLSSEIRGLSNESHPTGDMSEAPRLLPRASLKWKTPRGNSKGVRKTWKHPSSHQRWKV
ncbi:hypothetical protein TNCT_489501 [Trichonephila clavata]|uniref:Uncharacterized protein n=1 Tax=Trichonephila clavata TaxID=2740835 RepID=A0A8X6LAB1_TRICU|nr:hypothetical protein TNCT_489501 [Trichonephila clavata]